MTDRDRIELEMSPGMQPPSGLGDRVLVGLALVVLVAGAFIAVGNVLPDPGETGAASQEPSGPSRAPRPSPKPQAPRVATIEDPDFEIPPPELTYGFNGFVRALGDVVIRAYPSADAPQVGTLTTGDFAYAEQQDQPDGEPGWLFVQEPQGWIASVADGVDRVRRYEYPRHRYSGGIESLAAGQDGFVAMVTPPSGPDSYEPRQPAISTDGASWRSGGETLVDSWNGGSIAWGPSGWLAASYVTDDSHGRIWIWSSADGLRWTRLGMLGGIEREFVTQFLGSGDGYLLETYSEQGGYSPNGGTIWSSADGQTWVESTDPVVTRPTSRDRHIAALQRGFYLWTSATDPPDGDTFAAFSADGQTWTELDNGPDGVGLQLAELADGIVAIDLNRDTLAPRVWSGVLAEGRVSWIRESASDEAFAGGLVRQLVSDGNRVYAFGWDASTEEPLVWSGDGVDWVGSALPESFGGIPTLAAAGPAGVVVVGHRQTLRGDNPIFWHRTATGRWVPEPNPILELVPDPATDQCPRPPADVAEYSVIDAPAMVSCFGATPFSFRAYSFDCGECYGSMEGNPEPAWLVNPTENLLFLAPNDVLTDLSANAVLAPSLEPDPAWKRTWIEVTGHYDDPAALTCRQDIGADSMEWWLSRSWVIERCRLTFVVTEVKVVSGP